MSELNDSCYTLTTKYMLDPVPLYLHMAQKKHVHEKCQKSIEICDTRKNIGTTPGQEGRPADVKHLGVR